MPRGIVLRAFAGSRYKSACPAPSRSAPASSPSPIVPRSRRRRDRSARSRRLKSVEASAATIARVLNASSHGLRRQHRLRQPGAHAHRRRQVSELQRRLVLSHMPPAPGRCSTTGSCGCPHPEDQRPGARLLRRAAPGAGGAGRAGQCRRAPLRSGQGFGRRLRRSGAARPYPAAADRRRRGAAGGRTIRRCRR